MHLPELFVSAEQFFQRGTLENCWQLASLILPPLVNRPPISAQLTPPRLTSPRRVPQLALISTSSTANPVTSTPPKLIDLPPATSLYALELTALTNPTSYSSSASQHFEGILTRYQGTLFASPSTTKANIPNHHPGHQYGDKTSLVRSVPFPWRSR